VKSPGNLFFLLSAGAAALLLAGLYREDAPLRAGFALDAYHHLAGVRELAKGEFPPAHNLVAGRLPQGHYGPYLVLLGAVARWTGATPLAVLYAAGVVNLLLFVFAFRAVARRVVGEEAAPWSVLAPLLLWGPWPGFPWASWAWPGTTSLADSHNFFYPHQAGLVLLLAVLALIVPRGGEARAGTGLSRARRLVLILVLSALLVASHPLTGLAFASALLALATAESVTRAARPARLALLLGLPLAALAVAALWPYYPVLGLLRAFTQPELRAPLAGLAGGPEAPLAATGPVLPALPVGATLGPALLGSVWLVALARTRRPFLLLWFLFDLGLAFLPPLPLHQRFLFFAALPLQLAAAGLLGRLWTGDRLGRAVAVALVAVGALSAGQRIGWLLQQEVPDLSFLEAATSPDAVVLSDTRTSNGVAGLTGRKVVAPENPDLFLVMSGGWQRVADVRRFLKPETSPRERDEILRRWRPTHVLVDRLAFPQAPVLSYPEVAHEGGYVLYDVREAAASRLPVGRTGRDPEICSKYVQ
jgi:hypothetical protein